MFTRVICTHLHATKIRVGERKGKLDAMHLYLKRRIAIERGHNKLFCTEFYDSEQNVSRTNEKSSIIIICKDLTMQCLRCLCRCVRFCIGERLPFAFPTPDPDTGNSFIKGADCMLTGTHTYSATQSSRY